MTADPPKVNPLTSDWTVPKPPPEARHKPGLRGVRVATGIVIAVAGHLLSLLVLYVGVAVTDGDWLDSTGHPVAAWGQGALAVGCLITGLVLAIRNRDGGIGIGLIIGWAAGVPVVTYWFFGEWLSRLIGGS